MLFRSFFSQFPEKASNQIKPEAESEQLQYHIRNQYPPWEIPFRAGRRTPLQRLQKKQKFGDSFILL